MPTQDFSGRIALVTGGSSGVGKTTAKALVDAGARVIIAARSADTLERAAAEIGASALVADVASVAGCRTLIEQAAAVHGGLDILVNNAGAHHRGPVTELEAAELGDMVDTNLRAPIMLTRYALDHLKAAERASVVNVASIAGHMPLPGSATYSATKFGLRAFSHALAEELAETGVRVSVVSPGPIATGFILSDVDSVSDLTFSQPMSTPEQVAELILACIADGRAERSLPKMSRVMATAGYLIPALPRALRPLLAARGRRAKARYRS